MRTFFPNFIHPGCQRRKAGIVEICFQIIMTKKSTQSTVNQVLDIFWCSRQDSNLRHQD